MTTHTIKPATSIQLISDPVFAAQAAMEIETDSLPQPSNTTMSDALSAAQTTTERSIIMNTQFTSQRLAARVAFIVSGNIGKIATRIQKLANPPKSNTQDPAEIKAEIKECVAKLIWGYDNLGEGMRDLEEAVGEWCGGGYSRPRSESEIEQVAAALNISKDQAKASAETNRMHSRDFLTIRRQGLAPVMVEKISSLLTSNIEGIAPTDEQIEQAALAAFQNAILWGDWAEAALIQADAVDWLGKSLEIPKPDQAQQDKANRIREELTAKQAERAASDATALRDFNIDLAA